MVVGCSRLKKDVSESGRGKEKGEGSIVSFFFEWCRRKKVELCCLVVEDSITKINDVC